MRVSVIIPVYNAADFVVQAVESALQQPETSEVLLIEDGSPDNSWAVCQQIAAKHDRVRLLRHSDGKNLGAGASRNLGMKNSSCEFIAFLDADDYYLPGRFAEAKKIFQDHPDCDGVYGAAGMYIDDDVGLERWQGARKSESRMQTMTERLKPEDLPEALITGAYSYFILDSLVLKRKVLERSGYMVETLKLHQDTDFIIRVACVAKLWPGQLDDLICMWRIHDHNRISAPRSIAQKYYDRMLYYGTLYRWFKAQKMAGFQQKFMNYMVLDAISEARFGKISSRLFPRTVLMIFQLFQWLVKRPEMIFESQLWVSLVNIRRL